MRPPIREKEAPTYFANPPGDDSLRGTVAENGPPQRRGGLGPANGTKGRAEREFGTPQDRLVTAMRVAGVNAMEEAYSYLDAEFLPWWR